MEHKNIPIYKNEMSEFAPVANDDLASLFSMIPIVLDEVVVGFVDSAKYDGVDQILGNLWFSDTLFEKDESVEYRIDNIQYEITQEKNFLPRVVFLKRMPMIEQLVMEDF